MRRRKRGGSVWNKMKNGAQGWKDLGNKTVENAKIAGEKAKQESKVAMDNYKRQKAMNEFTPPSIGGKRSRKKRKTRRRKQKKKTKRRRRRTRSKRR